MRKKNAISEQFQRLNALKFPNRLKNSSSDGPASPIEDSKIESAPAPLPSPQEFNPEERGGVSDTVQAEQSYEKTVSKSDSVTDESCEKQTLSEIGTLQNGPCEKRTVSDVDTVEPIRLTGNFTQVPNEVLRSVGSFSEPIDFMIFLHLWSYSMGFGRTTVSMSQGQLERFTGASKNTVKRSLERLEKGGWIKQWSDYEHGRVSRTWKIKAPTQGGPPSKRRGSKMDSVQNEQSPALPQTLSKTDTLTVSKMDTYKDNQEINKKTLSLDPRISEYLAELKPERKRAAEEADLQELKREVAQEKIADALAWLLDHGVPGTQEPCHSPMRFLVSGGISRVQGEVEQASKRAQREQENREALERIRQEDERDELESKKLHETFVRAIPEQAEQERVIQKYAARFRGLDPRGEFLRNLAISAWASEDHKPLADVINL